MSCPLAHLDAAYVLGALAPEERLDFERHLPDCAACARAVGLLAGMPGLLAQVSAEVLESEQPVEPLPATLLPALVREVRREQVRRRWVTGVVAAAAVLAVGVGSVAVVRSIDDADPPASSAPSSSPSAASTTAPPEDMAQVGQDTVQASVALTSVAWGTRLDLTCSYAVSPEEYGETTGPTYALVVRSVDGSVEQVATWRALPGRTMTLEGATAQLRDDIAAVEVQTVDGRPVLELSG